MDDVDGTALSEPDDVVGAALKEFARELSRLHIRCGEPSLRDLERATKDGSYPLKPSTLSEAFRGKRLPSQRLVVGLVRHLVGTKEAEREWVDRWITVRQLQKEAASSAKPPPTPHTPTPAGYVDVAQQLIAQANADAERLRTEAAEVAARVQAEADTALREAYAEAERILVEAKEEAAEVRADATRIRREASEELEAAKALAERTASEADAANDRLSTRSDGWPAMVQARMPESAVKESSDLWQWKGIPVGLKPAGEAAIPHAPEPYGPTRMPVWLLGGATPRIGTADEPAEPVTCLRCQGIYYLPRKKTAGRCPHCGHRNVP
ncbi:hypothetical protein [Streptomyces sp. NPDC002952]|uniref:ATP synthase F0 subunit B n=1 Tax=Streptomyces sp. NPDC002952 TaxID=3364673 RepID=UPI00369F15BC